MSSPYVVTLKPRRALPFFSRHPWVYAGAIASISGSPDVGAEVVVQSHSGQFIARGLYNPRSKIRVRLYTWEADTPLDEAFWRTKLESALALRRSLFTETPAAKACRLVFSESDGLSGLTVDRFDNWLVIQWTSAALAAKQETILPILGELLAPQGIWQRTERGIGELEGLKIEDTLIAGEQPPRPVFIQENGLQFGVDLVEGQKTGFYFDQRENRKLLERYGQGRLLDLCSYTGSFSITGLQLGGYRSATAVDSSGPALEFARRNAELNGVDSKIQFVEADAFEYLEQLVESETRFDTVVLDPPKMARTRGGLERAVKGYLRLNRTSMQVLAPDGILITCSCSGHLSREDFEQVMAKASLDAGRTVQILEQRGAAPDHPVSASCLETNYLKCFVCRVS